MLDSKTQPPWPLALKGLASFLILLLSVSCSSPSKKMDMNSDSMEESEAQSDASDVSTDPTSLESKGSDSQDLPIQSVHFNFDSSNLSVAAREILSQNSDWIKENTQFDIQIEGHCDQRGSVEYNLALGERRAQSAKQYLENLGIDSLRLKVISYGEEKLLDDGDSEEAHKSNRRVNFVLLPKN